MSSISGSPTIPAGVWRHYKGDLYQVLGVAQHTESGELLVVYVSLEGSKRPGPRIRARPLAMFCEAVGDEPRFKYVGIDGSIIVGHGGEGTP